MEQGNRHIRCAVLQNVRYTALEICEIVNDYRNCNVVRVGETSGQLTEWLEAGLEIDLVITEPVLADGRLDHSLRSLRICPPLILTSTIDKDVERSGGFTLIGAIPFPIVKSELQGCLQQYEQFKIHNKLSST